MPELPRAEARWTPLQVRVQQSRRLRTLPRLRDVQSRDRSMHVGEVRGGTASIYLSGGSVVKRTLTLGEKIDDCMAREYGAEFLTSYADDPEAYSVRVYVNKRLQQKWLVEVMDGRTVVYSYCGEVK